MTPDPTEAIICEVVMQAAVAQATVAAPWLGLPIFHAVFQALTLKISQILFEELAKRVNFIWVDFETDQERAAYDKAAADLRTTHANPAATTADIANARKNFKETLSNLIQFHDNGRLL